MTHDYASPIVVKYGGNAMNAGEGPDPVLAELGAMRAQGARVVLVHGGGPEIDAALAERGIATRRLGGQRLTDAPTLRVTEAVLCATVNKRIVRACTALGIRAAGVSGQDGGLLRARRAVGTSGEDLGLVGEIAAADVTLLDALLDAGFLPVVAPLALDAGGEDALNVNADAAAGAIAAALRARALILVTNVPRVRRDPDDPASGIAQLTPQEALAFACDDACRSSMKPKLLAAAHAALHGVGAAYICAAKPHAVAAALAGDATVIAR